jgi:hypothetical protein
MHAQLAEVGPPAGWHAGCIRWPLEVPPVKRLVHLSLAALLVLVAASSSSAAPRQFETIVFEAVDSVGANPDTHLTIAGVQVGQTAVVERTMFVNEKSFDACHKAALLMMELPGRYAFEIRYAGSTFEGCYLRRR